MIQICFKGKTEVRGMELQKVSETRSLFLRRNEAYLQASTRAVFTTNHMLICMDRTVKCPTSANSASDPGKTEKRNPINSSVMANKRLRRTRS